MPTRTKLEFYKAFGIEANAYYIVRYNDGKNELYSESREQALKDVLLVGGDMEAYYPEITNRRLLELTVLANQIVNFDKNIVSVDELKDSVLDVLIVSKALAKLEEASVKDTVREIMGVE